MNPEIEMNEMDYEEMEAAFRELCADEFDALYQLEAAHAAETMPMPYGDDDLPF